MKKQKCNVCGFRFCVEKRRIYTATVHEWPQQYDRFIDVTECPQCGCQLQLNPRYPAYGEDDAKAPAKKSGTDMARWPVMKKREALH